MATTDINVFAQPNFNIKAWVNNICKTKPEDEAIDRYLAEMEMRLQLSAEEIEAGLQETSSQAMRRIPFAIQEIYRLQVCCQCCMHLFPRSICTCWYCLQTEQVYTISGSYGKQEGDVKVQTRS